MNILGRTTIHPLLFYSGKGAGYALWGLFAYSAASGADLSFFDLPILRYAAFAVTAAGAAAAALSFVWLGRSVRLGLPQENTAFVAAGIYRISRNPMYVGFDLFTAGAMLYLANPFVLAAGLYSIIVYHLIILGEERFLLQRFGGEYRAYCGRTRRYL